MRRILYILILIFPAGFAFGQDDETKKNDLAVTPVTSVQQPWYNIDTPDGEIRAYTAFPEENLHDEIVLVLHDDSGLDDFEKSVVNKLALHGFRAMAPELPDFSKESIAAVAERLKEVATGEYSLYIMGFGKGGTAAMDYADEYTGVHGMMIFYALLPETLGNLDMPVYAFYGGDDEVIMDKVKEDMNRMQMLGRKFILYRYPGAGHNFMQKGYKDTGSAEDRKAYNESWQQISRILGM